MAATQGVAAVLSIFDSIYDVPIADVDADEVKDYLDSPVEPQSCQPLDFWKTYQLRYPALSRMARDYLAIPGTSARIEEIFSESGEVISNERNRLNSSSIQAIMCLNSWNDI